MSKKPRGKSITILVRAKIKTDLMRAALKSGRTLSAEAMVWFDELKAYRKFFRSRT
jgi:hypothetical protein